MRKVISSQLPVSSSGLGTGYFSLWWLACAVASSLWCLSAATRLSATFDEPLYVQCGLDGWRSGSHAPLIRWGTMPLPADVQMLPLYLAERWRDRAFDPVADLEWLLPRARAMNLVFWWLLLAYGALIGRALAGPWGGALTVALLATEPNLLAHASLATTDIAVTACLLALVYHFRRNRDADWRRRIGVPMVWFAIAVLAKASALVVGPLWLIIIEAERLWQSGRLTRATLRSFARELAWIGLGGLLLVFIACGSDWRASPSFVAWAHALPDLAWRAPAVALAENLRVFSNAGEALWRQITHNLRGHGAYLLGATDTRALWYFFPVLLTIKLNEALLCAPVVAAMATPRSLANWPMLSALALLLYSVTFRVQLGVRMVLPLVALFAAGVAVALVRALHATTGRRRTIVAGASAGIVAWSAVTAALIWPHGLSYANRFWGGPADAYRLMSDSNYDWGQGVKELRAWQNATGTSGLGVWYFGTDPLAQRAPLRLVPLHTMQIVDGDAVRHAATGCRLAVGTTLLYGTTMNASHRVAAEFLRARTPIARTQTFLIYDLCL